MLSGLREAARALQLLRGPAGVDAADLVSSRTETLSKTDKRKRMQGGCGGPCFHGCYMLPNIAATTLLHSNQHQPPVLCT